MKIRFFATILFVFGTAFGLSWAALAEGGNLTNEVRTAGASSTDYTIYIPAVCKNYYSTDTHITTSGRMMNDEVWQGDILVTGDVEIPEGVTLTIEPGTTIRFTAQSDDQSDEDEYDPTDPSTLHATMITILVYGSIEALGTPDQPITFTTDSSTPGDIDWQSIQVEGSGAVYLDYVVIEYGYFGVQLNTATLTAMISNSTIQYVTTCCICTFRHRIDNTVIISDSKFIGCGREAIDTYSDQNIIVQQNVFSDNYVGIMSVGSDIVVENNLFTGNLRGMGVIEDGKPSITGNEFTDTDGAAIFLTDASPEIVNNNLYGNVYNVQLEGSSQDVTAENNWWGSDEKASIEESIWDGNDESSLGMVDYEPFATEAFDLDVPVFEK
jgi:hypothetical protein